MAIKSEISKLEKQLKLYKSIEKNNTKFTKMSKAQKRITIAKDVIASLRLGKFNASPGTYFSLADKNYREEEARPSDNQALLLDTAISCEVCAIGAIFASKVRSGNKCNLDLGGSPDDNILINNLKGIFTEKELRIIETAFEGEAQSNMVNDNIEIEAANWFRNNHPDKDDKRLIAIMKNIIKNKGTFVL